MESVLRSKFFWILAAILIPFFIIWIVEGLEMAIFAVCAVVALAVFIMVGSNKKKRRVQYYDDGDYYDDYRGGDRQITVRHVRRRRCPTCRGTGIVKRKLPPIHQNALGVRQTETCHNCRGSGEVVD